MVQSSTWLLELLKYPSRCHLGKELYGGWTTKTTLRQSSIGEIQEGGIISQRAVTGPSYKM